MKKRIDLSRKKVTANCEKQLRAKCEKYESCKTQKKKARKRTNVGALAKSKVDVAEGSTEERRKDNNGCTEVRNREEVPALLQDEEY